MAAVCVEETRAVLLWHAVSDAIRVARERYTRGGGVVGSTLCTRGARELLVYLWYYVDIRGRRGIHVIIELLHAVHGERWERYTCGRTRTGRDVRDAREVAASRERTMCRKI